MREEGIISPKDSGGAKTLGLPVRSSSAGRGDPAGEGDGDPFADNLVFDFDLDLDLFRSRVGRILSLRKSDGRIAFKDSSAGD